MSIVSDIDQFIVDRLSLIKIDGVPIPVLPYESSRDKGHMIYPCFKHDKKNTPTRIYRFHTGCRTDPTKTGSTGETGCTGVGLAWP